MNEQRAEKERQDREAKKAAGMISLFKRNHVHGRAHCSEISGVVGELLTGDMVSWKRERGNLTESQAVAMA